MAEVRRRAGGRRSDGSEGAEGAGPPTTDHSGSSGSALPILLCVVVAIAGGLYVVDSLYPCPIQAESFTLADRKPFTGALTPNNDLTHMEKILPGQFRGPESMAIHKGKMYTGVADGRLVEIDLKTGTTRDLVKHFGKPPCGGIANEANCGRPLGIRYKKGFVYVVDAYLGLFKVNTSSGEVENLFPATLRFPDGDVARFLNDVEVGDDGLVYVTDSSTRWGRSHHCFVGFESRGDGRLIVYNPKTKQATILLRGLYFANGLQLTPKGDALLMTEMSRSRVTKYHLKGAQKGVHEMFSDNLPGLPDNIRPSSNGGYWVALAVVRHPDLWSMWDFLCNKPWIRNIMARFVHRNTIGGMVPKYALILELDSEGTIIRSLHDQLGQTMPAISEVQDDQGTLYIGSYFLPFLGKLDLSKL